MDVYEQMWLRDLPFVVIGFGHFMLETHSGLVVSCGEGDRIRDAGCFIATRPPVSVEEVHVLARPARSIIA